MDLRLSIVKGLLHGSLSVFGSTIHLLFFSFLTFFILYVYVRNICFLVTGVMSDEFSECVDYVFSSTCQELDNTSREIYGTSICDNDQLPYKCCMCLNNGGK